MYTPKLGDEVKTSIKPFAYETDERIDRVVRIIKRKGEKSYILRSEGYLMEEEGAWKFFLSSRFGSPATVELFHS